MHDGRDAQPFGYCNTTEVTVGAVAYVYRVIGGLRVRGRGRRAGRSALGGGHSIRAGEPSYGLPSARRNRHIGCTRGVQC